MSDVSFSIPVYGFGILLEKAAKVVPTKEIMPVLGNFLVEVSDEAIRVVATDTELSVVTSTSLVSVQTPGRVLLPAARMLEIVKSAAGNDVSVEVSGPDAVVRSGRATWGVRLQDVAGYPPLPDLASVLLYDVDRSKFLSCLRAVSYAACQDASRMNMSMIDFTDGVLTAADGIRFQRFRVTDDFPLSLQIPVGAVGDIISLLSSDESIAAVQLGETQNTVVLRFGMDMFLANKMMVDFPDVAAMLLAPAESNADELSVNREDLGAAVKRVRINADADSCAVVLQLGSDEITVRSRDKFGNYSDESLPAKWAKDSRELVLNHRFLLDMLSGSESTTCSFLVGEDKSKSRRSPLLISGEDASDQGVLQQMRADWVA